MSLAVRPQQRAIVAAANSGEDGPNRLGWHCGAYDGITEPKDKNTRNVENEGVSHNHRFKTYSNVRE
jgi:hypothetical protein